MNKSLMTPVQNGHVNPTLELADGQWLFRCVTEGGTRVEQFRSSAAVREAMLGIPVDSEWLSPNLHYGGVVRWGVKRGVEWAVMFLPPTVHNLELTEADGTPEETTSRVQAPLPGMVWFGIGTTYFAFAVATERLDPFQELYRAPLPNVMADGSVCWGLSKPPQSSGKAVAEAWALFAYRTTFNNHVVHAKSKREPEDVRRLLRECARAGVPYPADDLRRQDAENGATLDKALRNFFETGVMPG
jgi:hypothetical protein